MADEKKVFQATSGESRYFEDLEPGIQQYTMKFLPAEEIAELSLVSTKVRALSEENHTWEHLTKQFANRPTDSKEKKRTEKDIYRDTYFLKIQGARGANLCRAALRRNPQNIDALSKLAFLIGRGETTRTAEDPLPLIEPLRIVRNIWRQNPDHLESRYYFVKLKLPSALNPAILSLHHYKYILQRDPNHTNTLYELAHLTEQGIINANDTDFLFPDSPPSPPWDRSPDYALTLKNRVFSLYQNVLRLDPLHEDALCGLADMLKGNGMQISPQEFSQYAALAGKPRTLIDPRTPLNVQIAAMLYHKVLAANPHHGGAVCGLADLISHQSILAHPQDFLLTQKQNGMMPHDLFYQEFFLYMRVYRNHPAAAQKFLDLGAWLTKKPILKRIPIIQWPECFREYILNFENLNQNQRTLIIAAIERAQTDHATSFNAVALRRKEYCLIATICIPLLIGCGSIGGFIYPQAKQLSGVWNSLGFAGTALLQGLLVAGIAYFVYNRIDKTPWTKQAAQEDLNLKIVTSITSDNAIMHEFFPELNSEQEENIPQFN